MCTLLYQLGILANEVGYVMLVCCWILANSDLAYSISDLVDFDVGGSRVQRTRRSYLTDLGRYEYREPP